MSETKQSFFLRSPVALIGLALFSLFVLLLSLVPIKEGKPLLGAAIALGAAAAIGLAVRMLQDRVYVSAERLEVHDLFGNRLAVFRELRPTDFHIKRFALSIHTQGVKKRGPFEIPPAAKYYFPVLTALHDALEAEERPLGRSLLETLRSRMLEQLMGGGTVGAAEMISSPGSAGLAEAANQRFLNELRAFLEERLGPTPGLRPIKQRGR